MKESKWWMLPSGIEAMLPNNARRIERLRRDILDLFAQWNYELVITPLVEYLESLLVKGDEVLDEQTLKLTDITNGKLMGIRADMTPQVARIDAGLGSDEVRRLCYVGSVLRAKPQDLTGRRALLQFGAEMYGSAGIGGSVEIICLADAVMKGIGIEDTHLYIGHAGIYPALAKAANLSQTQERELLKFIQLKSEHEIRDYLRGQNIDGKYETWFTRLISLYGDREVMDEAKQLCAGTEEALNDLAEIDKRLSDYGIEAKYDLSEVGSYHYENGMVFSIYVKSLGQEIINGGRYDNISEAFGRKRPAVGFSGDLLLLTSLTDAYL